MVPELFGDEHRISDDHHKPFSLFTGDETMNEATTEAAPATETKVKEPKASKKSTKPGEPAPKAKKEKLERVVYPGLNPDAEGKPTVKLKEWPADFNPKVHKQLKRSHFETDIPLLEQRIKDHEEKIKKLREEIEIVQKGGGKAKGKLKKLKSTIERFAELRAEMEKEGHDVSDLVKMFQDALSGTASPEASA
jgi:hypothetical protein